MRMAEFLLYLSIYTQCPKQAKNDELWLVLLRDGDKTVIICLGSLNQHQKPDGKQSDNSNLFVWVSWAVWPSVNSQQGLGEFCTGAWLKRVIVESRSMCRPPSVPGPVPRDRHTLGSFLAGFGTSVLEPAHPSCSRAGSRPPSKAQPSLAC